MAKKLYDVSIKVETYQGNDGNPKNRYRRIGEMMEGAKGPYLMLDSTILSMQLFALANKDRKERVICSLFAPKEEAGQGQAKKTEDAETPFDDDIPF